MNGSPAILPQFVNPALAWGGLAVVSVPILIHLLTRRPKRPREWAAMRFLLAVYRKHRRRSRLEQLLLLLVRCALLALIGFALAGPIWSAFGSALGLGGGGRIVVLVVDNGLSSNVVQDNGRTRLEAIKAQAERLLGSLSAADQVALITAAGPPEAAISPPKMDLDLARRRLAEVPMSESASELAEALREAQRVIEAANDPNRPAFVVLLSDFAAGSVRLDEPLPEDLQALGQRATLLRSAAYPSVNNAQVAELRPDRRLIAGELELPGQNPSVTWTIKLRRFGDTPARTQRVRLELPGAAPRFLQADWAEGRRALSLNMTTPVVRSGSLVARAVIEGGGDRLTADDERFSVVHVRKKLSVLILDRKRSIDPLKTPKRFLELAIGPEEGQLDWPIELSDADAAAASAETFRDAHVVFVLRPDLLTDEGWSDLRAWVKAGGVVWITPPVERRAGLWPQKMVDRFNLNWSFEQLEPAVYDPPIELKTDRPAVVELERLAGEIQRKGILRSVKINTAMKLKADSVERTADRLLVAESGDPMLLAADVQRGRLIFSAFALEATWSNLPLLRSAFPPLIAQLIRGSTDRLQPAEVFEVGRRPALTGPWTRAGMLVGPESQTIRLASDGPVVRPVEPLRQSGVYQSSNRVLALAANVRPAAGDTQAVEPSALDGWLSTCGPWRDFEPTAAAAAVALKAEAERTDWSWRLLWVVGLLAIGEMFLARWVSHASLRGRTEGAMDKAVLASGGRP